MKKNFAKATAFVLTAATVATAAAAPVVAMANDGSEAYGSYTTNFTAYVTNAKGANLRATAGKSGKLICNVKKGTAVQVIGAGFKANGYAWYRVSVNGTTGYMAAHLLSTNKPSSGTTNKSSKTAGTYTVSGTTNFLAVRTAAKYDPYNIVAKLHNGDSFTVTSTGSNGYAYGHTASGVYGFVNASFLK